MKDYLISSYIDDELDIVEKIEFVETVHDKTEFKNDAIDLLHQEKLIRGEVTGSVPAVKMPTRRRISVPSWRPVLTFSAALAAALVVMFISTPHRDLEVATGLQAYRFVLYQPDAVQVEITGSFMGWEAVPMNKSGSSGYWETVLKVPAGEHRLCYILEGSRRIPDPTIPIREKDDFGGENSILTVGI